MKLYIVLFFLGISIGSCPIQAFGANCPELSPYKDGKTLLTFIKPFAGKFQLGSCQIEIHTCEEQESNNADPRLVADFLIERNDGFFRYLPIYVDQNMDPKIFAIASESKRSLRYKYRDLYRDSATGRDERWALEIVLNKDLKSIHHIETGYSSQAERRAHVHKRWTVCGYEREQENLEYPVLKFFRSLRNWFFLWGEPAEENQAPNF